MRIIVWQYTADLCFRSKFETLINPLCAGIEFRRPGSADDYKRLILTSIVDPRTDE